MKNIFRKNIAFVMACAMLETTLPLQPLNAVENNTSNGGPGADNTATGSTTISMKKGSAAKTTTITLKKESAAQTTTVTLKKRTAPAAPSVISVNPAYIDETGKITGVDNTMEYSADNGVTWTAVEEGKTEITGLSAGTVKVRVKAVESTGYPAGAETEITIAASTTKHDEPAAPTVTESEISSIGTSDGKITGVDDTMEYSVDGGENWTQVTGDSITGLSAGEVKVRVKETESVKAGAAVTVTIGSTLAEAKEIAVSAITAEVGTDTSENVAAAGNAAKTAINAATTIAEVTAAKEAGIEAIRAAKAANKPANEPAGEDPSNTETELTVIKAVAMADMDKIAEKYPSEEVLRLVERGKAAIDSAKTPEEIEYAEECVIDAVRACLDREAAEKAAAAELAAAKKAAKEAVIEAAGERPSSEVTGLVSAAEKAIDACVTAAEVTASKDDAIAKIKAQRRTEAIKKIEGKEPSHLTIGSKTYWVLDGVSYEDPECTKEITNLAEWIVIPAEGHKWNTEATVDKKATCTEDGHKSVHCSACDATKDDEVIKAAGHKYGKWHITVAATDNHDGEKVHECEICHETETAATKYNKTEGTVNPSVSGVSEETGKIENITKPEGNACGGTINVTKSEILETFPITSEELEAVENGSDIGLSLVVSDISATVPAEEMNKAKEKLSENQYIAAVLDVSLFKYLDNEEAGRVTKLNKALRVYIEIPESIYEEGREYSILRENEGEYTVIALTQAEGRKFCFESDMFSAYYIVYTEKAHEHVYGEWKTTQETSWIHHGYVGRECECGARETKRVEQTWVEQVGSFAWNLFWDCLEKYL